MIKKHLDQVTDLGIPDGSCDRHDLGLQLQVKPRTTSSVLQTRPESSDTIC